MNETQNLNHLIQYQGGKSMIEAKNGDISLRGTRREVLEDTALLFEALLHVAPEVLIVCLKSYKEDLLVSVKISDPTLLKKGEEIVAELRKNIKDNEV